MFPKKTLYPGAIRTRVFCSSGWCDDHSATPPGQLQLHWLLIKMKVKKDWALKLQNYRKNNIYNEKPIFDEFPENLVSQF
jgi:hypothetical protein